MKLHLQWQQSVDEYVIDLAWAPFDRRLAFVTVEGRVCLVEDAGGAGTLVEIGAHGGGATSVSWRHDGLELATSGQDGVVRIWDPELRQQVDELDAGGDWAAKVAYQPRRGRVAAAAGKRLRVWSADRRLEYESSDHASTIADLAWNPDGSGLAVAAYFGVSLHVPDRRPKPRKYAWKGSSLVLAWSPDSHYIATGEQDSTVHFWKVKSGEDAQMRGFPTKVLELAWHSSAGFLATGGGDAIVLWDCRGAGPSGRKPKMFQGHDARITQLAFQRIGDLLASADDHGKLMIWRPFTQSMPLVATNAPEGVSRLEWSHGDHLLAVGGKRGTIGVLRVASS
ncbi:MAG: hypothetical protein U0939_04870 [Pirellulales bacterium]